MRKAVVLGLLILLAAPVLAQAPTPDGKLTKYIIVDTERVNPAKIDLYTKTFTQMRQALDNGKSETYWFAMSPITGDVGNMQYVMFANSLADIDKVFSEFEKLEKEITAKDPAFNANYLESAQMLRMEVMEQKPELSLWRDVVPGPMTTRYKIANILVKPGMTARYAGLLKEAAALQKDVPGVNWITYQSVVHDRGTLFTLVVPLKSLADLDVDNSPAMAKIFTPLVMKDFEQRVAGCVESVSSGLFMMQPRFSRVPATFAAMNPSYWTIKEEPVVVAEKGKKAKKAAVVPAAITKEEKK